MNRQQPATKTSKGFSPPSETRIGTIVSELPLQIDEQKRFVYDYFKPSLGSIDTWCDRLPPPWQELTCKARTEGMGFLI
jgi:hypothetical protein